MKVSLNWIKQLIDFELPPVDELTERIGAQLGAIEEVEDLGKKYQNVLVAKVMGCEDHPDSDHLHVCKIDDGGRAQDVERDEHGYVQVVCGAPNVREGLSVAWLPPGSTVPESAGKDPFVLGKRELRGVMSNGMLASARELALGDSHEGILEIDKDAPPGADFVEVYKLDDYVIDIENKMFTHRPDCFGALGVAREIAGILGQKFKSPDWYQMHPKFPAKAADLPLYVTNEIPELVARFSAITLADVQLGASPLWLQVALAKVGQKSINNIVDLTNFYMLLTGQPLHAYDYDKVKALSTGEATEITVRYPRPSEKLKLINGKEIEPRSEAMMIASGDQLIGLGGVMGGFDTEIDDSTRNIILEAANFDMYNIRRTSMAHGLFTDAVTRFNKGQSPLQTRAVLAKITDDIQKIAGGKVASELVDVSQLGDRQWVHPPVTVTSIFINSRLGLDLTPEVMKQLLENVECRVDIAISDTTKLTVTAPFWRTDIETREDVVEEVGRLYGFDKLPLNLPRRSIKPVDKDTVLESKQHIREQLSKSGANEVLTYSFVDGNLLQKVGQDAQQAFKLSNALSPDLQYYRLTLTPSLLDKIHANIKVEYDAFALFEIGKTHRVGAINSEGLPEEFESLALVYAARKQSQGAAYYEAKLYFMELLNKLHVAGSITFEPVTADNQDDSAPYYHPGRAARVILNEKLLGMIGEYKQSVAKALKLPQFCAGFEISLAELMTAKSSNSNYDVLSRFPKVEQDICLRVASSISYQDLFDFVQDELDKQHSQDIWMKLSPVDIYRRSDDDQHKQITLRLSIASYQKTMTDSEVAKLLDGVAEAAQQQLQAERI